MSSITLDNPTPFVVWLRSLIICTYTKIGGFMYKCSRFLIPFTLLGLITGMSTAHANSYIELNPGYSYSASNANGAEKIGKKVTHAKGSDSNDKQSGFGMNVNLGYAFNQYLAAELGATLFSRDKLNYKVAGVKSAKIRSRNNWGFDLAGRLTLPVRLVNSGRSTKAGILGVFVKAGPGIMTETLRGKSNFTGKKDTETHSAFAAAYGGGVEYNLTNHIAINSQVNAMTPLSNRNDFAYHTRLLVSGGLKYTF